VRNIEKISHLRELSILLINQIGAQNFCFTVGLFLVSTCFEHHVLIIRSSELYYTASGIITHIGGRPVHKLGVIIQPVHGTVTYMCDDNRGCVMQFLSLDNEVKVFETYRGMKLTYCKTKILCMKLVIS